MGGGLVWGLAARVGMARWGQCRWAGWGPSGRRAALATVAKTLGVQTPLPQSPGSRRPGGSGAGDRASPGKPGESLVICSLLGSQHCLLWLPHLSHPHSHIEVSFGCSYPHAAGGGGGQQSEQSPQFPASWDAASNPSGHRHQSLLALRVRRSPAIPSPVTAQRYSTQPSSCTPVTWMPRGHRLHGTDGQMEAWAFGTSGRLGSDPGAPHRTSAPGSWSSGIA